MVLKEFTKEDFNNYIELYNEFIETNSDLVPDILELECNNEEDYNIILKEIENRKNGNHSDIEWYKDGHYYLVYDNNELVGLGCIRNNLTEKSYNIWGHIACGIRPSKRNKGYGTEVVRLLVEQAKKMKIEEVILCHYIENKISPKILKKIGATLTNKLVSPETNKVIFRYKV